MDSLERDQLGSVRLEREQLTFCKFAAVISSVIFDVRTFLVNLTIRGLSTASTRQVEVRYRLS